MRKANMLLGIILLVSSCSKKFERLPILGETYLNKDGELVNYTAPTFMLTNQLSEKVGSDLFADKITVVDFFFTSCPTICPQMTSHLKLVEEAFKNQDNVAIISVSIDGKYDTPDRLKHYAEHYNIDHDKWTFLTGDSDVVFELAKDYKVRAFDDSDESGNSNFLHDGTFVLVDGRSRVRGYYNGLDYTDTKRLIRDINILIKEH